MQGCRHPKVPPALPMGSQERPPAALPAAWVHHSPLGSLSPYMHGPQLPTGPEPQDILEPSLPAQHPQAGPRYQVPIEGPHLLPLLSHPSQGLGKTARPQPASERVGTVGLHASPPWPHPATPSTEADGSPGVSLAQPPTPRHTDTEETPRRAPAPVSEADKASGPGHRCPAAPRSCRHPGELQLPRPCRERESPAQQQLRAGVGLGAGDASPQGVPSFQGSERTRRLGGLPLDTLP